LRSDNEALTLKLTVSTQAELILEFQHDVGYGCLLLAKCFVLYQFFYNGIALGRLVGSYFGYSNRTIKELARPRDSSSAPYLSTFTLRAIIYGCRIVEQLCSYIHIIGGRLHHVRQVTPVMFELGKGFVIDDGRGTTVVAVERASVVDWPFGLLGFVFLDAAHQTRWSGGTSCFMNVFQVR
jgi:hypothetical protein